MKLAKKPILPDSTPLLILNAKAQAGRVLQIVRLVSGQVLGIAIDL